MATQVNIHEAKTHLSRLVERAAAGEEITIAKAGRAVARLVALEERLEPRTPGFWRGKLSLSEDWDSAVVNDEISDLFYRSRDPYLEPE